MSNRLNRWAMALIAAGILSFQAPAWANGQGPHLVSVAGLEARLKNEPPLILDASPLPTHAEGHIPGAVHVDLFGFMGRELVVADMERRLQSWGISPGRKIVIYDAGASYMAARLIFDLHHLGVPAADLAILDGGMAKWRASGGAVTKDPTPRPERGTFVANKVNEDVRVRLPEFLVASGDPARHVLLDALEATHYYGQEKFFDRGGHVPNAVLWPSSEFFNPDKTFKSADELRRMAAHLGIRPEQTIHTHCGGGGAASVPFFALKFMLGYPKVKLYNESQREWLQDDRDLPFWTYGAPQLRRGMGWLNGWNNPMMRAFGIVELSIVDPRAAESYALGHVPYALNVPADQFKNQLKQPDKLAAALGAAGVNPAHEAVVVSDGGLNPRAALAYLALERLGQRRVSILMESMDEWGLGGLPLTKEPTVVGAKKAPQDMAVPAAAYPVRLRTGVVVDQPASGPDLQPTLFVASGKTAPARAPQGTLVHLPYTELLKADGSPKPAADLWGLLAKAGIPRTARIVCIADDLGEAAVMYFVLKLMGFPSVVVQAT